MTKRRLLVFLPLALLLSGCYPGAYPIDIFIEMHYQQSQRRLEPSRLAPHPEAVPITGRRPMLTFEQAGQLQNPIQRNQQSQQRAARLYQVNCAMCHGADGRGQSPVSQRFQQAGFVPPVDFAGPRATSRNDGQLYWIVTNGLSNMPPFGDLLTDDERWLMVQQIRQFQGG